MPIRLLGKSTNKKWGSYPLRRRDHNRQEGLYARRNPRRPPPKQILRQRTPRHLRLRLQELYGVTT